MLRRLHQQTKILLALHLYYEKYLWMITKVFTKSSFSPKIALPIFISFSTKLYKHFPQNTTFVRFIEISFIAEYSYSIHRVFIKSTSCQLELTKMTIDIKSTKSISICLFIYLYSKLYIQYSSYLLISDVLEATISFRH